MVSSTLYEKVTFKQIDDMKHALGFSNKKVTGTKYRKYTPYRNRFYAGGKDIEDWKNLVLLELAEEHSENIFSVTEDGMFFLKELLE